MLRNTPRYLYPTSLIPKWNMKADYIESCNFDYSYPCNLNGFPIYGFCRALVLYHIQSETYRDIKLDN